MILVNTLVDHRSNHGSRIIHSSAAGNRSPAAPWTGVENLKRLEAGRGLRMVVIVHLGGSSMADMVVSSNDGTPKSFDFKHL